MRPAAPIRKPDSLLISAMIITAIGLCTKTHAARDDRWFPEQRSPAAIVRTIDDHTFPAPQLASQMMVQSIAGLAAKAVNDSRGDELVWVGTRNADLESWYTRMMSRGDSPKLRGTFTPWDLVDRFRKKGIIKGYILYKLEESREGDHEDRSKLNLSVNVATSVAGLMGGILIDEHLEPQAKQHSLKRLLDARHKTQAECFQTFKAQFNRNILCTQDPRKPNVRDLAIAHNVLTIYGDEPVVTEAMKWLEPLSPIIGWNGGDEFESTRLSTIYGHFQTATDWCVNLPVLMAGSAQAKPAAVKSLDPNSIDWNDNRSAVSFIDSDGDNVQWLECDFFANKSYWDSPDRGRIPFGWSCCFAHLSQLCPTIIDYAIETQTHNDSFVEWGGGYYYPELFAKERPDRWGLLARHARRTWHNMQRNNTRLIAFNLEHPDSPDALEAYKTFAREADGLLGILAYQYSPYEGGAGKTFWVKDKNGVEIPAITARYAIWEHTNDRPRSGTPAKVAREIQETIAHTSKAKLPRYDWVIDHVWSSFRRAPGSNEAAENFPEKETKTHSRDAVKGYSPVTWCAERLPSDIRVISPEELVWRIRAKHNPEQTKAAIQRFRP
jgi:hypothetical protein